MISTLCVTPSAQATCKGEPMIGLHLLIFAPASSRIRTSAGSPRKMAKCNGLGLSCSPSGGIRSTLAPCLIKSVTRELFPDKTA